MCFSSTMPNAFFTSFYFYTVIAAGGKWYAFQCPLDSFVEPVHTRSLNSGQRFKKLLWLWKLQRIKRRQLCRCFGGSRVFWSHLRGQDSQSIQKKHVTKHLRFIARCHGLFKHLLSILPCQDWHAMTRHDPKSGQLIVIATKPPTLKWWWFWHVLTSISFPWNINWRWTDEDKIWSNSDSFIFTHMNEEVSEEPKVQGAENLGHFFAQVQRPASSAPPPPQPSQPRPRRGAQMGKRCAHPQCPIAQLRMTSLMGWWKWVLKVFLSHGEAASKYWLILSTVSYYLVLDFVECPTTSW